MAYRALKINSVIDCIDPQDPDKDNPTIWKLGILDSMIKAELDDEVTVFESNQSKGDQDNTRARTELKINQAKLQYVRFGLKGFENYLDPETDKPVVFDTTSVARGGKNYNVVSDKIMRAIPSDLLARLADKIKKLNEMTEQERKN